MLKRFGQDRSGQFGIAMAVAVVPILGGLALALDFAQMSRERQEALNALDAAGIASARRIVEGGTDEQVKAYAKDFFEANLASVKPANTDLTVVLPNNNKSGGGTLKLTAKIKYEPYFLGAFASLIGQTSSKTLDLDATSEIRLKNTLEVALVLDNSGSMSDKGSGSGKKRIDLLKDAAKQLVDTIAAEGKQMKQLAKPVQFSLVPFAASVNVGSGNANAVWMDTNGLSPVHHENFDWTTMGAANANKKVEKVAGIFTKKGTGWGTEENTKVTRFTLFNEVKRISGYTTTGVTSTTAGAEYYCSSYKSDGSCKTGYWRVPNLEAFSSWGGCVEVRPPPYATDDTAPSTATPATLFVPMFAPDEASSASAQNSWWPDVSSSSSASTRQKYMPKYFSPYETSAAGTGAGPNASCTTKAITELTDVTTETGLKTVKDSIDAMAPLGGTNVPEGMAWGWRTLSSAAPFTGGRAETEKGNDKVVIVLTDGENTYYTPSSLGYSDSAGNKSIYSNYGYTGLGYNGTSTTRLFMNTSTSIPKTTYSNSNYTAAMNEQFATLCTNAKAKGIIVMTIALDLSSTNTVEKTQIDMLKTCSSDSRFRKDSAGKAVKLFWNSTGATLSDDFKDIADELSNLRIVG